MLYRNRTNINWVKDLKTSPISLDLKAISMFNAAEVLDEIHNDCFTTVLIIFTARRIQIFFAHNRTPV